MSVAHPNNFVPLETILEVSQLFQIRHVSKANTIYLLVLRAPEAGKNWKMWVFKFILFILESAD